ncbi:unnamed protein product [Bursaphelenchus xylophilus]|uniref:(pine wood nematode) hypothetical protein n=1 Tax=Bursaphelenchus xylophilus TaxID=6326 RepID=A0A7I8WJJ1_BURXY|nr:unnamed protein product [Bursaphelenchus xylophilus]CAG9107914.1 unnamed protein product [Bursaphelenchus xylophilus]
MDAMGRLDECLEQLNLGESPCKSSSEPTYRSRVDDIVAYYEKMLLANAEQLMNLAKEEQYSSALRSSRNISPFSSPTTRRLPASRFPCYRWECSISDNTVNRSTVPSPNRSKNIAFIEDLSPPESTFLSNVSTFNSSGSSPYYGYYGNTPPHSAGSTWSDLSEVLFDPEDEDSSAYQVQRITRAYRTPNHYPLPECREESSFDTTASTVTNLNTSSFSESSWSFWEDTCEASSSSVQGDISPSVLGRIFQFKIKDEVINIDFNDVTNGVIYDYSWRLDLYAPQFRNALIELTLRNLSKMLDQNITHADVIEKPSGLRKRLANSIRSLKLKKEQRKGTFQRNLKEIRNRSDINSPLPVFIHCIMDAILNQASQAANTGLFRTAALKTRVEELRKTCENLDANDVLPLTLADSSNLIILADIFKQFIREIPGQLLSKPIWQLMMKCVNKKWCNQDEQFDALRACIALIDLDKRDALCIIMFFLKRLSKYSDVTLMTVDNLVSVFMPTICKLQNDNNDTPDDYLANCKSLTALLSLLISEADDFFKLPTVILVELESPLSSKRKRNMNDHLKYDQRQLSHSGIISSYSLKTNQEYRSDAVLEMNTVDLFRFLIENRTWDPTFTSYQYLKTVSDDIELISARTKWCPSDAEAICISRMSTRHYAKIIRKHTFILIERSAPLAVYNSNSTVILRKLHFILRRIDAHRTNVTFVLGIDFRNSNKQVSCDDLIKHTCDVMEALKGRFHTDPIYC